MAEPIGTIAPAETAAGGASSMPVRMVVTTTLAQPRGGAAEPGCGVRWQWAQRPSPTEVLGWVRRKHADDS
jgi:hypothetical protein